MDETAMYLFQEIIDYHSNSLVRKVIYRLQRVPKEAMVTGDDSVLKSFWEEVCVQVQDFKFDNWLLAEDLILEYSRKVFDASPSEVQSLISYEACQAKNQEYEIDSIYPDLAAEFIFDKVKGIAGENAKKRIKEFLNPRD